jgi:phosphate transport system ATP-binding protein
MTAKLHTPPSDAHCADGSICINDLNVYYGERHALKNININLPTKSITAIIGPSGCGKTTLLKCFNRLIDSVDDIKVSGQVLVDGDDIFAPEAEVTDIRKRMGLLSQRPYPLPMSIYENVAFGPKLHGVKDKAKLNEIVEFYLKQAMLWDEVKDRLNTPASRLSIGQQQRLCLARGLAVEPDIILGDEPTSALDPISSHHIEQKFLELKKDYTIVVVTHILRQARRIADYLIFMYLGEIIEHGPAKEILENPKEKRTQEYVKGIIS